jgi:hypothetical protein
MNVKKKQGLSRLLTLAFAVALAAGVSAVPRPASALSITSPPSVGIGSGTGGPVFGGLPPVIVLPPSGNSGGGGVTTPDEPTFPDAPPVYESSGLPMQVSPLVAGGVPVHDARGYELFFNEETGVVYNDNNEVVVNASSTSPISYEPKSGVFASINGDKPIVVTQQGKKYLSDRGYTLGGLSLDDYVYLVVLTNKKTGYVDPAWAFRVKVDIPFGTRLQTFLTTGELLPGSYHQYFDLSKQEFDNEIYSVELAERAHARDVIKDKLGGFFGTAYDALFGGTVTNVAFGLDPHHGTARDLFTKILVEGGPADTDTAVRAPDGSNAKDSFGTDISVINNQLVDGIGLPLISVIDAHPCYFYNDEYVTTDGQPIVFNQLEDGSWEFVDWQGNLLWSSLEYLFEGGEAYYPYLRSNTLYPGQARIPAVGKKATSASQDLNYYDFNGNLIDGEIVLPNLSKEDWNAHHPDDPIETPSLWDQIVELLRYVLIGFICLLGAIAAIFVLVLVFKLFKGVWTFAKGGE